MEHLFCDFETSLKLKALGFNEPCCAYYTSSKKLSEIGYVPASSSVLKAPMLSQAVEFLKIKDIKLNDYESYHETLRKEIQKALK